MSFISVWIYGFLLDMLNIFLSLIHIAFLFETAKNHLHLEIQQAIQLIWENLGFLPSGVLF